MTVAKEGSTNNRREQIIEIATHLFQKGFGATSLAHVAAEMGVTRPALYYYFPSFAFTEREATSPRESFS